jgi:PIN domain nuclease of toxin-antitoxin system
MTGYILDTHALLWFISNDTKLSSKAKSIIENADNDIILSAAIVWEISIKAKIGKIRLHKELDQLIAEILKQYNFTPLAITIPHVIRVNSLPDIHRDPFDRVLVAQSISEDIPLITADPQIKKYKIKTVW